MQLNTTPSNLIPVQFNAGTFHKVTVRSMTLRAGGPIVQFASATTVPNLHIEDIYVPNAITSGVSIPAGQTAGSIRCNNINFNGTNFVTTSSPTTIKTENCDFNTSGAVINATGAGASPITIWHTNYNQAGAGADAAKDGTQTVSLNKANYTSTSI
jgi:hypothetical protein